MPSTRRTNADYRTDIHAAVRRGLDGFTGFEDHPQQRYLVRSIADQVLTVKPESPADPADFPLIKDLPDAPAIAWADADHKEHIALRYGHPGNGVWLYNGKGTSAEDILKLTDGLRVAALDFRSNPQTSPSEVF